MEREYIKALTDDIEKAITVEDKVSLIQVFLSELAEASADTKDGLSAMTETIDAAAEMSRGVVKTVTELVERVIDIEKNMLTAQKHLVSIAESTAKNTENIQKILDQSYEDEIRFQKFSELVFKKLDKI